jgi:thiosulfate/3-mercaptopyruvate sulfurtransferase
MPYATLVDAGTLARHLEDPGWAVVDCRHELADPARGRAAYLAAHLPGARYLHLEEDLSGPRTGTNGRHPLPDPSAFRATLERAGIGDGAQVVAYDAQGGMVAARLWWMLRWLGHPAAAVLDGGWGRWVDEGRPTTAALPALRPATFTGAPDPAAAVDAAWVLAHLRDPAVVVLDARGPDRHRGEHETIDPVAGRIPGSRNRFYQENLGPDGRFKPAEALARDYAAVLRGAAPGAVVASCGSGVSACHDLLAMEVAGLRGARLYPGSWSEWCADPARPVARGEPSP